MGFACPRALFLLFQLSLICFTAVSGEDIEAVPPIPPRHHGYNHQPAVAPTPHHHRHHGHSPSPAPTHHHHGHPPSHPPAVPPMHHAPAHPPMPHSPAPVPAPPPKKPSPPPAHVPAPPPKKPSPPPAHVPAPPPKKPSPPPKKPSPPPAHPPARPPPFPRSLVAVQGVVYCKSCKYPGAATLLGATPVLGATVKLQCNNTKYPLVVKAVTDKNGYFFVEAPKTITTYGAHKCKVFLVSAPNTACSKITDLHGGISGGVLKPEKAYVSAKKLPFVLYSVGPFAFEPKCPR